MSASFLTLILVLLIQGNSEAVPVRDYDGIPSGSLHAISGVVPMSVPRRPEGADKILQDIRKKVDKAHVSDLSSSIRDDIIQDAYAPKECLDKYGIRDGFLKHTIRGTRDVIGAIVKDFEGLGKGVLKNVPLVPHVINGIAEAITYTLCGAEKAVSDAISGIDDAPNIITKILVDLIEFNGSALENLPSGVFDATRLIKKIATKIAHDVINGIEEGVEDLAVEVKSGVTEVVTDVKDIVTGVEEGVEDLAAEVESRVTDLAAEVKSGVTGVVNEVGEITSGVENEVSNVVNAVGSAAHMIGGGVGSGVRSIVGGIRSGLGGIINAI